MTESEIRQRNEQTVRDFLRLLAEKDMDAWANLWAKDAVQEMPFSPAGFPTKVVGRDALLEHYSGLPEAYGAMAFPDLVLYPMLDPNWVLAEYRGEIHVLATARPYNNQYCGLFHLYDGKIILFREYYNPTVLTEAFGDASALSQSFNLNR
jgi:ketosteroid isomerase-like protein